MESPYVQSVEANLRGLDAVSTGYCPGCETCATDTGYETVAEYDADLESGALECEPHFSWGPCGICGSHLGGDREPWHAIDKETGALFHGSGACVDCLVFLANGDEPERWEA